MSAFIVLTIGPVQSYISQARRTQDLWQSSRILSHLAGVGVRYAQQQESSGLARVIYPHVRPNQIDNIPNRIVVKWLGDADGARSCAAGMEVAIRNAWRTLSANTLRYFIKPLDQDASENVMRIWERQEDNWLECYWVVVPESANKSYAENMLDANAAIGARKLIRNFSPVAEPGRKCSITGEHEALHDGRGDYVEFWKARQQEQRNLALLGKHERLSAISTIKRMAHEEEAGNDLLQFPNRFPSTSSIAAVPFKYDVLAALVDNRADHTLRHQLEEALASFIENLLTLFEDPSEGNRATRRRDAERLLFFTKKGVINPEYFPFMEATLGANALGSDLAQRFLCIDGDFLFEDTLISKTIEEYGGRPANRKQLRMVQQALTRLLQAASALKITKPQPYFVILSMDGDHMGRTLGELRDEEQHRQFSITLSDFANEDVTQITEWAHLGRYVYAGGDDVLALLPVRGALQVAERLRTAFATKIRNANILDCAGNSIVVHASIGLAYVHHTHNLQDAVRAAAYAQKEIAKDSYGRNAIGVQLLRRSGESRRMGQKWIVDDQPVVNRVLNLTQAFADGHLSRNLPMDIAQMIYSMADDKVPEAARRAELSRILKRRLTEVSVNLIGELLEHTLSLATAPGGQAERWRNAQCWLELARFIAQKEND